MINSNPNQISAKQLDYWIKDKTISPFLIDVREIDELNIASLPLNILHLPLSAFEDWSKTILEGLPIGKPIVVLCHSGIRSNNFGIWLLKQNDNYDVWNLIGGIDAWSLEVDPKVPRY